MRSKSKFSKQPGKHQDELFLSRRAFWNLSITGSDPKLSADKVAQRTPSQKAGQLVVFSITN